MDQAEPRFVFGKKPGSLFSHGISFHALARRSSISHFGNAGERPEPFSPTIVYHIIFLKALYKCTQMSMDCHIGLHFYYSATDSYLKVWLFVPCSLDSFDRHQSCTNFHRSQLRCQSRFPGNNTPDTRRTPKKNDRHAIYK